MQTSSVLEEAFRLLEKRPVGGKDAPFERYTSEVWEFIDQRIPNLGPEWYRTLTARYRVGGAFFDYPVEKEREWLGLCTIPRPSTALYYVYSGWPVADLHAQGWFAFAEGCDGNLWVFESQAREDPNVHVLELSAWDGGTLAQDNGLISLRITLSRFLRHGANWARPEKERELPKKHTTEQ